MARAMVGDRSDNLEGIPGIGLKTVAKRFPFLQKESAATFDDILQYCRDNLDNGNIKAYSAILENDKVLKHNYKMMQLYSPLLTIKAKNEIRMTLQEPDNSFNRTELIKMMLTDGFGEVNFVELFQHFNKIALDS
jgi:5'-3' exonuclease